MQQPQIKIEPRPYRMHNRIQHYAWGMRGKEAFIPRLLNLEPQPGVPYAELWMGTHPNAPSQIELPNGQRLPLSTWLTQAPDLTLGPEIARSFGELPFLFKVLSAAEPLSIQAHPNKAQAARLHAQDPEHYPDPNHKPEIAIAIDELTALMGFRPFAQLQETLNSYPEIATFIGERQVTTFLEASPEDLSTQRRMVWDLFAGLVRRAHQEPEALQQAVDALVMRLSNTFEGLVEIELRFLDLQERYGSRDVGLFVLFLLNLVHLGPGEGLFLPAGVPHAYLHGNIVECMANSDNVIRVGLTPKFKDAETLLEIIDTTPGIPEVMHGEERLQGRAGVIFADYKVPVPEFRVRRWALTGGSEVAVEKQGRPAILLVIDGTVELYWGLEHQPYHRGDALFLPACLERYTIHAIGGAELFQAEVPLPQQI